MYSVSRQNHTRYGNIICIEPDNDGEFNTPFWAVQKLRNIKRLWKEESPKIKIRYLIDGQIMTISEAETWAIVEYKSLPKCEHCNKILGGHVYTHSLCGTNLFCSQECSDKNYINIINKREDEEEHEFEL